MAAAWKYKAEESATKPLVSSLLMPLLSKALVLATTQKLQVRERGVALQEYLTQSKVRAVVNMDQLLQRGSCTVTSVGYITYSTASSQ